MNQEIRNGAGERLDYTVHQGKGDPGKWVVLGHGVTGNKDRPFLISLASALAETGFNVLRLSFSGNGSSEGRFEDCTITKETGDLAAVLDALGERSITYAGHSMGAAVGVISAAKDARISRLVSLAGMVNTADFVRREFGTVKPGSGFMWDEPSCPLSQAYVDDLNGLGSLLPLAKEIRKPWLLVHGTEDDVVPVVESRAMAEEAAGAAKLIEMQGANHVFSSEEATNAMTAAVSGWLLANR